MAKKLFVAGLSYDTVDENLKSLFEQSGLVHSARVITDRDTGQSKSFGFVEMSTPEEATKAIKSLNGIEFEGHTIKVKEGNHVVQRKLQNER